MIEIGKLNELSVLRETDIAYLLTDGSEEVFLHKKEAEKPYLAQERLSVFVYVDNLGRKTASTRRPVICLGEGAFLEVVGVNLDYGVFLGNRLIKDLLLSKDDLPLVLDLWPQVGDWLFVTMKAKKEHLFAKFVGRKEIATYFPPAATLQEQQEVEAHVQYLTDEGLICFTKIGQEIFVHKNNQRRSYRLGELIQPRILKVISPSECTGTLIRQKETMIPPDAERILDYLNKHHGSMRFTDKSSPEEIQAAFKMSKSAFKRALGSLYKAGTIELSPTATKLKSQ